MSPANLPTSLHHAQAWYIDTHTIPTFHVESLYAGPHTQIVLGFGSFKQQLHAFQLVVMDITTT